MSKLTGGQNDYFEFIGKGTTTGTMNVCCRMNDLVPVSFIYNVFQTQRGAEFTIAKTFVMTKLLYGEKKRRNV